MGKIKVNFTELRSAIAHLEKVEGSTRSYAEQLKHEAAGMLADIPEGREEDAAALKIVNKKSENLLESADQVHSLAGKLSDFEDLVLAADGEMKSRISGFADAYETKYGIQSGFFEQMWSRIGNGAKSLLNQTKLGQWVNRGLRHAGDWVKSSWEEFKEWYALDGGRYVMGIIKDLGLAALAVFSLITAGAGVLALIAAVSAAIAGLNAVTGIIYNLKAYRDYEEDPAWAYREGKNEKVSAAIEMKYSGNSKFDRFMRGLGKGVDAVDTVCDIILFMDSGTKFVSRFSGKETFFQKCFGSGGKVDSFLVSEKGAGPAGNVARKFDPRQGRWKLIERDGQEAVEKLDFSYKSKNNRNMGFSLKGLRSSYQTADGETKKGSKLLKELIKKDWRESKASRNAGMRRIKEILSHKGRGSRDLARDVAKNYIEGSVNAKNIARSIGKDFKNSSGIGGFSTNRKKLKAYLEVADRNWKKNLAKVSYAGTQINNGRTVLENILNLRNGNVVEFPSIVKKLNRVLKHFKNGETGKAYHIGRGTTCYENINYLLN